MPVLLETLRVLTTLSSVLLNVSPWPEFAQIQRQRTPGPLTVLPVVALYCNSFLWTMYGYMVRQLVPLFATTFMGQCTCIGFISIYYRWTSDRAQVRRLLAKAGSLMALAMLYVVLGANGLTRQSRDDVISTLGLMCVTANICLYAAPLDTMKRVIDTRSAASLPVSLCAVNFLNGVLWVAFAFTEGDWFVFTPNFIGTMLTAVQLVLYFMYRNTEESRREAAEIQAAADALQAAAAHKLEAEVTLQHDVSMSPGSRKYGSTDHTPVVVPASSIKTPVYHSIVDVREKESLLVAAA